MISTQDRSVVPHYHGGYGSCLQFDAKLPIFRYSFPSRTAGTALLLSFYWFSFTLCTKPPSVSTRFVCRKACSQVYPSSSYMLTCMFLCEWMISLDTRSFSPRLSVLSYPAISANACLVTLILSHVSFISFLALKHLHELAILATRTHVCRALVRVCTYSFFSIVHCLKYSCFVSARKCTH